jgi:paraquat-inducible protein A
LHLRKPGSIARTWALLAAAAILYVPANLLPVMTVTQFGRGVPNTILSGVMELAADGLWPLAAVVFVASITVPILKIGGLAIMLLSIHGRARRRLRERTRLYRIVEAIGRWSMVDVFMISILTGMVRLGVLASVYPGPGAVAFCAVVILTMVAAATFDPRLMWDAAGRRSA